MSTLRALTGYPYCVRTTETEVAILGRVIVPQGGDLSPEAAKAFLALNFSESDRYNEHFRWHAALLFAITPIGRATVALLEINRAPRVEVREALIAEGLFPPHQDHGST